MGLTIFNARVFDGSVITGHSAVRIDGGHIGAMGGSEVALPGDERLDARGGTLLPGLIDAHLHLLPGAARQAITFGVTTGIDQFSKPEVSTPALAENSATGAAEIRTSTIGATAPGGHPTMAYAPFPYVTGPQNAAGFVADRIRDGASHLKIIYSDPASSPMPMPSLSLATVRALVQAAHEAGILVVAHVTTAQAAIDTVEQGVDILAHVPFEPLTGAQVSAIAAAGVPVITTLAIADGFPGADGVMPLLTQPELADRLGPAWTQMLQQQAQRWMPPDLPDFTAAQRNIAALHTGGVPILAGTDAPNPGLVHGASLHRELQYLVAAGLNPVQALRAATSVPAGVVGLDDRGAIRPGLRADLILVSGQPDVDISATQAVAAVWKQGVAVDLDGYLGSAAEEAGLAALRATNDKIIAAVQQWTQR